LRAANPDLFDLSRNLARTAHTSRDCALKCKSGVGETPLLTRYSSGQPIRAVEGAGAFRIGRPLAEYNESTGKTFQEFLQENYRRQVFELIYYFAG